MPPAISNHGLSGRLAFLPQSLADGLRRAARQFLGLMLTVGGLAFAIAFASFDPGDPSFNHVTNGSAQNLLGLPGAWLADLALQTTGLAAGVLPLALAAWGWPLLRGRKIGRMRIRIALLPLALLLAAVALAAPTPSDSWPLAAGYGGVAGDLLLAEAAGLAAALGADWLGVGAVAALAALFAASVLAPTLAFDPVLAWIAARWGWRKLYTGLRWAHVKVRREIVGEEVATSNRREPAQEAVDLMGNAGGEQPPPPRFRSSRARPAPGRAGASKQSGSKRSPSTIELTNTGCRSLAFSRHPRGATVGPLSIRML